MTSRSMAFKSELRDIRTRHVERGRVGWAKARRSILARGQNRVRALPARPRYHRRFCPPYGLLHWIRLRELREIPLLFQRVDDAEVEVVVGVLAADVGPDRLELGEHVLCARERGRRVARHQALEVGIGSR